MRAIGKVLRGDMGARLGVRYRFDGWELDFGPSVGVPGFMYVALTNPRGWQSLEWFETRAELFAWVDKQRAKYQTMTTRT